MAGSCRKHVLPLGPRPLSRPPFLRSLAQGLVQGNCVILLITTGSLMLGVAQALGFVTACEVTLDWEVTGWPSSFVIFNPNRSGFRGLRTIICQPLAASSN